MKITWKVLDLFCCGGGASGGYHRGGCEVMGVDQVEQPEYPFKMIVADAVEIMRDRVFLRQFDFIHASPPCQSQTTLTKGTNQGLEKGHARLIPITRHLLNAAGVPYVIENVAGSSVRKDLLLCGGMFGLNVRRHRYFEFGGVRIPRLPHPKHEGRVGGWNHGSLNNGTIAAVYGNGSGRGDVAAWQDALGIDWITKKRTLAQAIPPAYTEWIIQQVKEAA